MKLYTVHIEKYGIDPAPDIRLIKEGFNWAAFIFSVLWSLIKGYWWVSAGILTVSLIMSFISSLFGLDLFGQAVVNIAFNLLVGVYANDLARWTLKRRGFIEEDVVSGVSYDHALRSYIATLQTE
jgi:hypothetical protein